jgi:hypothetical protein
VIGKYLEEKASYGTDVYGAHCRHIRSVVVRIHLKAKFAVCAQSETEKHLTKL